MAGSTDSARHSIAWSGQRPHEHHGKRRHVARTNDCRHRRREPRGARRLGKCRSGPGATQARPDPVDDGRLQYHRQGRDQRRPPLFEAARRHRGRPQDPNRPQGRRDGAGRGKAPRSGTDRKRKGRHSRRRHHARRRCRSRRSRPRARYRPSSWCRAHRSRWSGRPTWCAPASRWRSRRRPSRTGR